MEENSNYKDLIVWQKAIEFADDVLTIVEGLDTKRTHYRLLEQIEAAATSVPMNIAEGKGRSSSKEFSHFLMIARGSLYETLTLLEIFARRQWITQESYASIEKDSIEIAKMINALNKRLNSPPATSK